MSWALPRVFLTGIGLPGIPQETTIASGPGQPGGSEQDENRTEVCTDARPTASPQTRQIAPDRGSR